MKHYEIAAKFREALLAAGWALRYDNFGQFLVHRDGQNVDVHVHDDKVTVRLRQRSDRGGYRLVRKETVTPAPGGPAWSDAFVLGCLVKLCVV